MVEEVPADFFYDLFCFFYKGGTGRSGTENDFREIRFEVQNTFSTI